MQDTASALMNHIIKEKWTIDGHWTPQKNTDTHTHRHIRTEPEKQEEMLWWKEILVLVKSWSDLILKELLWEHSAVSIATVWKVLLDNSGHSLPLSPPSLHSLAETEMDSYSLICPELYSSSRQYNRRKRTNMRIWTLTTRINKSTLKL